MGSLRGKAAITEYELDDRRGNVHVVCDHEGNGIWRVFNKAKPEEFFLTIFIDEKTLIEEADELYRKVSSRAVAEAAIKKDTQTINRYTEERMEFWFEFYRWCRAVEFQNFLNLFFPWTVNVDR